MKYDAERFAAEVYEIVAQIPKGKVVSYGEIARLLCAPGNARRVGSALGNAPADMDLPCHRVVNSTGRPVPGWAEQRELLEAEGVVFKRNGCVDMLRFSWQEIR